MISFEQMKLPFKLDPWQKEVLLDDSKYICLNNGRQTGKTEVIAIKTAEWMMDHPKNNVMIISITEDQAMLVLNKIMNYLIDNHPGQIIKKGKNKPTRHKIHIKNGSSVITKAVGATGAGVRGHTIHVLVGDEASRIEDVIWDAATPMLLTTGGRIWLMSTPHLMKGYFYRAYTQPELGFKTYHNTSYEVAESRPPRQREIMLQHLEREKLAKTALQFAQEYLAQFLEELGQFFPDELIKECQNISRDKLLMASSCSSSADAYVLGVDVARMGGDETTYEILQMKNKTFIHIENRIDKYVSLIEIYNQIIDLDMKYKFRKIYIDDAGLGAGVYDLLLDNNKIGRRVEGLNNAKKSLDREGEKTKRLFKVDLYTNLKLMMEQKQIQLLKDSDVFQSLKSVIYETDQRGKIHIYGRYTHIAEGLVRAAWARKGIPLKLWASYS